MHFKYIIYLLFSAHCVAQLPPGGPQDGLSGQQHHNLPGGPHDGLSGRPHQQTGGPQDGLPVANDDDPPSPNTDHYLPDNPEDCSQEDPDEDNQPDLDDEMPPGMDFLFEGDLSEISVEIMDGDKQGSQWLLVEEIFICHR